MKGVLKMKVLIVGYGSMGRRRIRLIKSIQPDVQISCVDNNPSRQEQIKEAGYICYTNLQQAIDENKPDISFVCTSPGHHAEIILQLVKAKIHVFTELNLTDTDYDKIIDYAKEFNVTVFMSSTMLYNKQIIAIDEIVKNAKKPLTYIYHIGQYLPDWHPWESYKDFFIGQKDTNGVREIYAIQLPWIINTFGKVDSVSTVSQRCTNLDIKFNDAFITTLKHTNGNIGVFVADVVSRKANTSLEIIGEDLHLFWDGHFDGLKVYDSNKKQLKQIVTYESIQHQNGYADNIIENQYIDEIKDFLSVVYKGTKPKYSIEQDKYTLSIINKIEGKSKRKVCFIGFGSIAKRHIENLRQLFHDDIFIDVLRSGKGKQTGAEQNCNRVLYDENMLDESYDAIFITNPTKLHYETLLKYRHKSHNFFIEKPVFDNEKENIKTFTDDSNTYYVACPLRYTNVIQTLKKEIDFSKVHAVRCISSSYLPDWRPNTDYRQTYSAKKELGGGVAIDLIHEWDYICYLMGIPKAVKSIISKKSNLEINSDDIAVYIADYEDKVVEIHLDYFGRKAVRKIELYCEEDTIIADLIDQKICWMKSGKIINLTQERNEFQKKELQHFFDIVDGKILNDNSIYEAYTILKIAKGDNIDLYRN